MIPGTPERVPRSTNPRINEALTAATAARVDRYAAHPEQIDRRLSELDREWDVERTLEANASTIAFIGVALGAFFSTW